jgi:hypothetical protein
MFSSVISLAIREIATAAAAGDFETELMSGLASDTLW